MRVSAFNSCSLRGFKRSRVSSEENENDFGGNLKSQEFYLGKDGDTTERAVEKELKKMRLDLEQDSSRDFTYQNSNSESSSPKTPSSHSPFNAIESSTQNSYHDHFHFTQEQKPQSSHQQPNNSHKSNHHPLRISTRSDAYSSLDAEFNPYANINSLLYLANLTRSSHIINELQGELGNMDIDGRGLVGMSDEGSDIHDSRQNYSNYNSRDSLSVHLPSIS
ncbi:1380_t:CDS:2, partial [Acaulospora colombiana]